MAGRMRLLRQELRDSRRPREPPVVQAMLQRLAHGPGVVAPGRSFPAMQSFDGAVQPLGVDGAVHAWRTWTWIPVRWRSRKAGTATPTAEGIEAFGAAAVVTQPPEPPPSLTGKRVRRAAAPAAGSRSAKDRPSPAPVSGKEKQVPAREVQRQAQPWPFRNLCLMSVVVVLQSRRAAHCPLSPSGCWDFVRAGSH